MLKRLEVNVISHPVCYKPISNYSSDDFLYYDKDGFELNLAEQNYYNKMHYPLNEYQNHKCFQQIWFTSEIKEIIIDHCLILHRCRYENEALDQLKKLTTYIPQASLLAMTKAKWGFDCAIDSIDSSGNLYEVLHIEYDDYDYYNFMNHMLIFEYKLRHIDWVNASLAILEHKSKWENLKGFEQNNWKANYLLGWTKAEFTEKTI
jgi:hypothetical protein